MIVSQTFNSNGNRAQGASMTAPKYGEFFLLVIKIWYILHA
jgi:hypothetical protein